MARIDAIEIHPLVGLDDDGNPVEKYKDVKAFDVCNEDDENILCWGVYLYIRGEGVENIFDVVDKESAEKCEKLLNKLYNLK